MNVFITIKTVLRDASHENFTIKNDIICKTDLLIVPEVVQADIIKTAHEQRHFAILRTQKRKILFILHLKRKKLKNASTIVSSA